MPRPRKHFDGDDFRFDLAPFRSCIQPEDATPPDAPIHVWVDPALTAAESSDRSALLAVSQTEDTEMGSTIHNVLGARTSRWRGIKLADAVLDFYIEHSAVAIHIERIPGVDLLCDVIQLKANLAGIEIPQIDAFAPSVRKGAKNSRIRRLSTLLGNEQFASGMKFWCGPSQWGPLFDELDEFVSTPGNRGKQINTIDCLALACGLR